MRKALILILFFTIPFLLSMNIVNVQAVVLNPIYKQIPLETIYAYFSENGFEYVVFKNNSLGFYRENTFLRNITLQGWIGGGEYTAFKGVRYAEHVFIPVLRFFNNTNYFYFIRYDYKRNISRWYLIQSSSGEVYAGFEPYIGYDYLLFAIRFNNTVFIHGYRVNSVLNNSSSKAFIYSFQDAHSRYGNVLFDPEYVKPILHTNFNFVWIASNNSIYNIDTPYLSICYQIRNIIYICGYDYDHMNWYYTLTKYTFSRFADYGQALVETIVHYALDSEYDFDFTFAFPLLNNTSNFIKNVLIRIKNNQVFETIIPYENVSQISVNITYHVNLPPHISAFKIYRFVDSNFREAFNTVEFIAWDGRQISKYAVYFPFYREVNTYFFTRGVYTYQEISNILKFLPNTVYSVKGNYVLLKEPFQNISIEPKPFNSLINIVKINDSFKQESFLFTLNNNPLSAIYKVSRGFHWLRVNYTTPFHVFKINISYFKNGTVHETKTILMTTDETPIPFDHDYVFIIITKTIQDKDIIYNEEQLLVKMFTVEKTQNENLVGELTTVLQIAISLLISLGLGFTIFSKTQNPEGFLLGFAIGIGLLGISNIIPLGWSILFIMLIMLYFMFKIKGGLT